MIDPAADASTSRRSCRPVCEARGCHVPATQRVTLKRWRAPESRYVCDQHAAIVEGRQWYPPPPIPMPEPRKPSPVPPPRLTVAPERCTVPGCCGEPDARGRCRKHYRRAQRGGWVDEDPAGDEARWAER